MQACARTGKVPMPLTFGGTAEKRKPVSGRAAKPVRCSTIGMPAASSIDIERIDADEPRILVTQIECGFLRQEGMPLKVAVCAPVSVPAGVNKNGMAATLDRDKMVPVDRALSRAFDPDDDARHVRNSF